MPKKMERKLKKSAKKRGLKKGSDAYGAYVYGTMQEKTDWKPHRGKSKKGKKCK